MPSTRGPLWALRRVARLFRSSSATVRDSPAPRRPPVGWAASGTIRVTAPGPRELSLEYAPDRDGDPDAGEIVWTWIPYEENDGRGKDRPVLVIARHTSDRVYAVRLTSSAHDGDRDYLALGSGAWDARGRPSWVDLGELYSVPARDMRREGAALDRVRYDVVAAALSRRYGWRAEYSR